MIGTRVFWVLIIIIAQWVRQSTSLIAYDCEDKGSDISAISIRDVAQCPEPESEYISSFMDVQVIQKNDVRQQKIWTCLVEVTRIMSYCGMHSHSSLVSGGLSSFVFQIGPEECTKMHRTKMLKIYDQQIGKIMMNGSTTASMTLIGHVDAEGNCKGATYHEEGQSWENVYVLATIKIFARDYFAQVKLEQNEVSLSGGVTCSYTAGHCFDISVGESVWEDASQNECGNDLSTLYRGPATQVKRKHSDEKIIVVEGESKIFALSLIRKKMLCHQEVWQTEHPKLLIVEGLTPIHLQKTIPLTPYNTDLTSYVNSKFLYIEQGYKRSIDRLYTDTIHRRCMMHREMLKNRLLMAPFAPHAISQTLKLDKGYIGRVLGEVLYVMKCVPKIVKIRRSERCFHELPIEIDNRSMYMAPITHIIQHHAEEVECNILTPPLYYIDNEWVGLNPYPTIKSNPKELSVEDTPKLEFSPIQPVGQYGLYTQDEVSKVQRVLTFGTERKAVGNIIARRVAGLDSGSQGYSTLKMFDSHELKELAHNTMRQVWGWFTDVGLFFSGLLGFYVIFRMFKYCMSVVINGLHLYETIGGGLVLLASLWNTLTMVLINRHHQRENKDAEKYARDNAEDNKEEIPQLISTDLYPSLSQSQHWTEQKPFNIEDGSTSVINKLTKP